MRQGRGLRPIAVVRMIIYNGREWVGEAAIQAAGEVAETDNGCAEGGMGQEGLWCR